MLSSSFFCSSVVNQRFRFWCLYRCPTMATWTIRCTLKSVLSLWMLGCIREAGLGWEFFWVFCRVLIFEYRRLMRPHEIWNQVWIIRFQVGILRSMGARLMMPGRPVSEGRFSLVVLVLFRLSFGFASGYSWTGALPCAPCANNNQAIGSPSTCLRGASQDPSVGKYTKSWPKHIFLMFLCYVLLCFYSIFLIVQFFHCISIIFLLHFLFF